MIMIAIARTLTLVAALLLLSCGLYQVTITMPTLALVGIIVLALALALAYLPYVFWVFKRWNANFSGRRNKHPPSNRNMPPITTLDENKELILNNSKLHEQFDTWELLKEVQDMEVTRKKNRVIHERAKAKRTSSLSRMSSGSGDGEKKAGALLDSLNIVETETADELDMDHV